MRLWVTRPEPDAGEQAAALADLGHETLIESLLRIEPIDGEALPLNSIQAVVIGSRNALRALARRPEIARLLPLPLYAVGEATAAYGRALAFEHVHAADGDARSLIDLVARLHASGGTLLHPAGDHLAGDLKGGLEALGFAVVQPIVYRACAVEALSEATQAAIRAGRLQGVILMSPRTSRVYVASMERHGLADAARNMIHYCLSAAVAGPLRALAATRIAVAARPSQSRLLALIGKAAAH